MTLHGDANPLCNAGSRAMNILSNFCHRSAKTFRWVMRLAVAGIVGLFATVGVSVYFALWAVFSVDPGLDSRESGYTGSGPGWSDWSTEIVRQPGRTIVESIWRTGDSEARQSWQPSGLSKRAEDLVPGWATFVVPQPGSSAGEVELLRQVTGYGWPCPALWHGFERSVSVSPSATVESGVTIRSGWVLPRYRALPAAQVQLAKIVPYGIVSSGFLVDLICYWFVAAIMILLPGILRRVSRRARGRCVRCGYDLRSLVGDRCPECGHVELQEMRRRVPR
jgi:hypothetical protein